MRCNFCWLEDLKRVAEQRKLPIELKHDVIYRVTTTGEEIKGIEVLLDNTRAAWFWTLSDHCVCNEQRDELT